ncbi:HesA/MoeB/ThiF family protein [Streptococcus caballi]|uniref:HesA/MoeB/ThiF family protein n=1 Tax=Streptococcus caballi TaxID=439220 RepID=UPI00036CA6D0|nr:ThiF family adenylyltransferase [Streptococcus caballi]
MYYKPMVKPMLVPFVNEEGTGIRIGGAQAGISRDIIVDEPELFYEFLKYLDGSHDIADISKMFNIDIGSIEQMLDVLKDNGVIFEDDNSKFSEEEQNFYSRAINFYKWIDTTGIYYNYWEVQERLKNAKVLLLGCGGTGSIAGVNLARIGFGHITVVDFDTVELSNLNRQMFKYSDVGKKKSEVLEEQLKAINPFIKVKSIHKKIDSVEDVLSLGTDYDVLICCIDKPTNVNDIVQEYTELTGIPWVLGGYASTMITQGIFYKGSRAFSDLVAENRFNNYTADKINANTYWKWDNAICAPVANISGSFSALYALYYISGLKDLKCSIVQHIDLFNIQNLENFSYIIV